MKFVRVALLAVATALACALVLAALFFTSGVQTWVVRRALGGRTDWHASVGAVAVGLDEVRLRDTRFERRGIVLTLPSLLVELPPISAGLRRKVFIRRMVAKGWTLDLTGMKDGLSAARRSAATLGILAAAPDFSLLSSARADPPPAAVVARAFSGIFTRLNLPMDLSLDGVELEGDVLLPPAPGSSGTIRAHLLFGGGGLGAGSEGRFTFSLAVAPPARGAPVSALHVDGTLAAAMSTPRTFDLFSARINAAATGVKFPAGVRLSADLGATRGAAGETYTVTLAGDNKQLATVLGDYSDASHRLDGTWKLDVCDDDVSPFALGRVLPLFDVVGEGRFDTDATLSQTHVSGVLNLAADRLTAIRPEFSAIGAVKLKADFDLTHRGGLLRVDHLQATLAGAEPILTVQGLQPFAFNADTGELQVADATRDLFGLTLQGVPVEWTAPFLRDIILSGDHLHGELTASARDGGLTLRSKAPLSISGLSATRGGRMLFRDATVSVDAAADYTPRGWQMEVKGLVPGPAHSTALIFSSKWGRLAGAGQAIKAVGHVEADLPTILTASTWPVAPPPPGLPAAEPAGPLTRGRLVGDFTASLGAQRSIKADLQVSDLAANSDLAAGALPAITVEVRADFDPGGRTVFSVPIVFERGDRKSDLTVSGSLVEARGGVELEGQATSTRMVVDDLRILAASVATAAGPEADGAASAPADFSGAAPFWGGVSGRLQLSLKKVEFPDVTVGDVSGTVLLGRGKLRVAGLKAALAEGSDCRIGGELAFSGAAPETYALQANILVNNFDPAPILQALNPDQPPTVEGKFNLSAQVSGRGPSLADLAAHVHGDCQVKSKGGGTFRMLSTGMSPKAPNSGKVAAIGNFIGDLATAVTGRKDAEKKIQAIMALAQAISPIQFDQLSFGLTRDAALDSELKDFALISPELRLTGGGRVVYREGTPLFDQPMTMAFKMSARGHTGDLLKSAGVLETAPDELGYVACTLPIRIGGTLGRPDTSDLQATLLKAAYDKSGAGDLLDKLLGK